MTDHSDLCHCAECQALDRRFPKEGRQIAMFAPVASTAIASNDGWPMPPHIAALLGKRG